MKARQLKKGDIIGVCAPSGIIKEKNKKELQIAEERLKSLNLGTKYSENLFANSDVFSASVEEKVTDLNKLILDDNVNAIAFAKGGNNSNGMLDYINYSAIRKHPKIIFGFSDNTVLLNAIYKKTGLITYHFTNFKGLFESNIKFNKQQFIDSFIKGYKGNIKKSTKYKTIRKGKATGTLIGGNLGSFVKLLNTSYCPKFKNSILFLEDLAFEDGVEQVSSHLYQLKMSKVFDDISGLILGNYDTNEGITLEEIVSTITREYSFPILKCDDFGHTDTNIVLPIGLKVTVDADNKRIIINETTVDKGTN